MQLGVGLLLQEGNSGKGEVSLKCPSTACIYKQKKMNASVSMKSFELSKPARWCLVSIPRQAYPHRKSVEGA
jgi:hypothetical protein